MQALRKREEGGEHPDRAAQFHDIHQQVYAAYLCEAPALWVDAQKTQTMGNYANKGREYHKKGQAPGVKVYDFVDKHLGKVVPYGVYDIGRNDGFVNVGISADTAEFVLRYRNRWTIEIYQSYYLYTLIVIKLFMIVFSIERAILSDLRVTTHAGAVSDDINDKCLHVVIRIKHIFRIDRFFLNQCSIR